MHFTELRIWKQGLDLSVCVNKIIRRFPSHEKFGLISQMSRASISVPSNIAEGEGRKSTRDFIRFLNISQGSLNELQTQVYISRDLGYISDEKMNSVVEKIEALSKQITCFRQKLRAVNQ